MALITFLCLAGMVWYAEHTGQDDKNLSESECEEMANSDDFSPLPYDTYAKGDRSCEVTNVNAAEKSATRRKKHSGRSKISNGFGRK